MAYRLSVNSFHFSASSPSSGVCLIKQPARWYSRRRTWISTLFGLEVLPSQIQAANPFLILVLIPLFTLVIYPAVGKVIPLTPLRKVGAGLFLMVISFAIISLAQEAIDRGETPSVAWQLLAYVIFTTAEILISIVCLEFAYTQSPPKMKSFIMSIFLVSVAAGNLLTGAINTYIQIPEIKLTEKVAHAGYDNKLGTTDDITLDDKIIHSAVQPLLQESMNSIIYIYGVSKKLPTTASGNKAFTGVKDPWGNDLKYTSSVRTPPDYHRMAPICHHSPSGI